MKQQKQTIKYIYDGEPYRHQQYMKRKKDKLYDATFITYGDCDKVLPFENSEIRSTGCLVTHKLITNNNV